MDGAHLRVSVAIAALTLLISAGLMGAGAPAFGADANSDDEAVLTAHEADQPGRIDYGYGIGVKPRAPSSIASAAAVAAPAGAPSAGAEAKTLGLFGSPSGPGAFSWPIVPLHVALLPDGRVFNFGTTEDGKQGGFVYDVWDPAMGTGAAAHTTLPTIPNGRPLTDIFCAGQALIGTSKLLIAGGDLTIDGNRNHSIADAEIYDWSADQLLSAGQMAYPRWYPTVVPRPNGEMVILGGRQDFIPGTETEGIKGVGVLYPEVYAEGAGWRTLTTAGNDRAYGAKNWFYPRGFQGGNGKIVIIANTSGKMFYLDPTGTGTITGVAPGARPGGAQLPALMYRSGKILTVRQFQKVDLVDVNGKKPVITAGPDTDQVRFWANTTLMADGKVLLNGGSTVGNKDIGTAYKAQVWDPDQPAQWADAAVAQKMRLYHSTALLLPDATVLTAAGGAPGPVRNLNAEIYYPPYLYNSDGTAAARPTISVAPQTVGLGSAFQITVSEPVSRVTFLRIGSATHSLNADQRFFDLAYSGGTQLTVTAPSNVNFALPGYYMLFVFNQAGVPSVAKIMRLS
ncbi:MAG: galactose oxidase-like domain-containing protein [Rhodospirillales bacterium]